MSDNISASYETRKASPQTIVDIFGKSWKSEIPGGLNSGVSPLFADSRPAWFASKIPNGLFFKSVLELGPFEGYQTYLLDRLGAKEIVSVEGNNVNFLKCLCIKEILGTRANLRLGNIMEELRQPGKYYDVLWASGVLYHMDDLIEFIELACRAAPFIYIWTHFHDAGIMEASSDDMKRTFIPKFDKNVVYGAREIKLHARSYGLQDYSANIPMYWEGAPQDATYWLEYDDIRYIFERNNYDISHVEFIGDMDGVPVASFAAFRR